MGGLRGETVIERLAEVPLFAGVSKKGLRQIAAVAKEMTFAEGETVTVEATRGGRFHLIVEGRVEVTSGGRLLATLGPGDTVGEMALLDEEPRTATVTALETVRTLSLASWNFRPLLRHEPLIMEKILLQVVRRLRDADLAPAR